MIILFVHFYMLYVSEPEPTEHAQITCDIPNFDSPPNKNLLTILRRLDSEYSFVNAWNSDLAKNEEGLAGQHFVIQDAEVFDFRLLGLACE